MIDTLYCIPFYVEEGSRISMRATSFYAYDLYVNVMLWKGGGSYLNHGTLSKCKAYGANIYVDNFGVYFTHSSDNEWGDWELIAPSTLFTSKAISLGTYSYRYGSSVIQLGTGLPGYEQPFMTIPRTDPSYLNMGLVSPMVLFPIVIGESEMISIRSKSVSSQSGAHFAVMHIYK
jgi:hypothetical protein